MNQRTFLTTPDKSCHKQFHGNLHMPTETQRICMPICNKKNKKNHTWNYLSLPPPLISLSLSSLPIPLSTLSLPHPLSLSGQTWRERCRGPWGRCSVQCPWWAPASLGSSSSWFLLHEPNHSSAASFRELFAVRHKTHWNRLWTKRLGPWTLLLTEIYRGGE